ncbi:MAG: CvpA family protein [Clostridiales bacterium]|nr:CvpA family protein [Clostridiales bacterium]
MSASIVSLIVSLLFVVILVCGFLVGLWRGLKRSAVNMAFAFVGVLIAFFVTPFITNALLGININIDGQSIPLREIALYLFQQEPDMAVIIETNANLKTLVLNLPSAVLNAVLFMVVTAVIESILYIVYKILAKTVFKYRASENKHRVWGGVVGLVKTFLIAFVVFMPFSSLIGLVGSMTGNSIQHSQETQVAYADGENKQTPQSLLSSLMPTEVIEIINGLDENIWTSVCGIGGIDDAMFDYYANVEIEGEKLLIREEISNAYQTANTIYGVSQVLENPIYSIKSLNWDELEKIVDGLVEGGLFRLVVAETLGEMLVNYQDYDLVNSIPYESVLENISQGLEAEKVVNGSYAGYFEKDIKILYDVFRIIAESGMFDEIALLTQPNMIEVVSILTNEDNSVSINNALKNIFKMNMFRASAETVSQEIVDAIFVEENKVISVDTSTWTEQDWEDEADSFMNILSAFAEVASLPLDEIIESPTKILNKEKNYNIKGILSATGKLLDAVPNAKLFFADDGKSVFISLVESMNFSLPTQKVYNVKGEEVTIDNYEKFFEFVADPIIQLRDNEMYNFFTSSNVDVVGFADILSAEGNKNLLCEILLPLYQIDFTKEILDEILDFSSLGEFEKEIDMFNAMKSEIEYFSEFLVNLNSKSTTVESQSYTYLELVLDSTKSSYLLDALSPSDVVTIFQPLFYMQTDTITENISIIDIKKDIIGQMMNVLEKITGSEISYSEDLTGYTFKENSTEDQTAEFLAVMEGLIKINKNKASNGDIDIKTIDNTTLGETLEKMKANAYRTSNGKSQTGIFGGESGAFVAIINKAKTEYETEINSIPIVVQNATILGISDEDAARYQSYYDNLTAGDFDAINYENMFADFAEISDLRNQMPSA